MDITLHTLQLDTHSITEKYFYLCVPLQSPRKYDKYEFNFKLQQK